MKIQAARLDILTPHMESQKITKQIENMMICFVDVEDFTGGGDRSSDGALTAWEETRAKDWWTD